MSLRPFKVPWLDMYKALLKSMCKLAAPSMTLSYDSFWYQQAALANLVASLSCGRFLQWENLPSLLVVQPRCGAFPFPDRPVLPHSSTPGDKPFATLVLTKGR